MEAATLTVEQFQSICRACLCDCNNVVWFNIEGTVISENAAGDIISKYASIQVNKDDALPKKICQKCLQDLINCHRFVQKCQKSDQTLLSILNKGIATIKVEKVEPQFHDIKQEEIDLSDLETEYADKPFSSFQKHTSDTNHRKSDFYIDDKEKTSKVKRQIRTNRKWCRCKRCGQTFRKLSSLQFHYCVVRRKKGARSDKREKPFNKGSKLKVTMIKKQFHQKPRKLCLSLSKKSSASRFVIQENEHSIKPRYASPVICQKTVLKRHQHDKPYECGFREKHFTLKGDLIFHKRTHAAQRPDICEEGFRGKPEQTVQEVTHTEKKPYKCEYLEGDFTTEPQPVDEGIHTEETSITKCGFCDISFVDERRHAGEKPYMCGYCEKSFARNQQATVQERTQTGDDPYKCGYCGKGFKRKYKWVVHERIHTGEKPFKCGYCEKSFRTNGQQVSHERVHTGEKPYKCGFCDAAFARKEKLTLHEKTHTGEKPHKCGYCGKSFISKGQRVVHERTHTGEKPFKCGYCEKCFSVRKLQVIHERTHTGEKPYKCGYCEKGFRDSMQQVIHERIHTGEKPYKCGYCDRSFAHKGTVTIHERTHTGEKPYQCRYCDRGFRRRSRLTKHERTHEEKGISFKM